MDQALQAVRGDVQGGDVEGVFFSSGRPGTLRLKDLIDLTLDIGQFCLRLRCSDAASEGIERIQCGLILRRFAGAKEFPGCRQHGDQGAEDHGCQKDRVSPFVQKTLLGAVVERGSPG
jgi:hypothetical protein